MKRAIVFIFIILLLTAGAFYISQNYFSNKDESASVADNNKPGAEAIEKTEPTGVKPDDKKTSGLRFGVGASADELLSILGEPKAKGEFEGSYYLSYDTVIYYIDSLDVQESKVTAITLLPGQEVYGIKVGMTPNEIKAILGTPISNGNSEEDGTWSMLYQINDDMLYFSAKDENSPTESLLIKREE